MKQLFILLLWLPFTALGQKPDIYGKFTNSEGSPVRGTSVAKGYERQIEVQNLSASSAKNNTTVQFRMPTSAANTAFQSAANTGNKLKSGEITVVEMKGDKQVISYRIIMQQIQVEECSDKNGITSLTLKAGRIGWIYYSSAVKGSTTIVSKSGWDAEAQKEWTDF